MKPAPVIAVVGPSGVGKDSVIQAMVARAPAMQSVRRVITRPDGEEGEMFDRVSADLFEQMVRNDAFALHWRAHGLRYGVPRMIETQRHGAEAVLVNLSRAVLMQAQEVFRDLVVVSLTARSEVLAQRLRARGRESASEQVRRLRHASKPLPEGLHRVIAVDNSGPLAATVDRILADLQPERA